MLVIAQVRLTSHFLGELKPDSRGIRRFKTTHQGRLVVNQNLWLDDLAFAAHTLKLEVNSRKTIVPPDSILPASVHLHRRVYSGAFVEFFESIRKGTILTFDMLIRDDRPRHPDLDQLRSMLSFVGEHCGISPWGKKFGMGRFSLMSANDRYQNIEPPLEEDGDLEHALLPRTKHDARNDVRPSSDPT